MPKAKMEAISLRRCSALIRSGGVWLVVFIGKGSFLTNCVNSKLSKKASKKTTRELRARAGSCGVLPENIEKKLPEPAFAECLQRERSFSIMIA